MWSSGFEAALEASLRHRRVVLAGATVAVLLGVFALWTVPLNDDIALMLPAEAEVQRSMAFLRESNLSDKVVLSFAVAPDASGFEDLLRESAAIESRLGPPLVTRVESGIAEGGLFGEIQTFVQRVPQLVKAAQLAAIDEQLTPQGVDEILRRNYRQLISPGELMVKEMIRADPLGLSGPFLETLQGLASSVGYDVEIEQGRFVSRDLRHALLLLETPVPITDSAGGRELVAYLRDSLAGLPEHVSVDIVAGHLHTISNEDVIEYDVIVGLSAASVGFLALFLFLYRDVRAIALFVLPVASVVIAIGFAGLMAGALSGVVVGMGGVVAGIAIDYAIHVYMAIRAGGGDVRAVRFVAGPIVIGALTTLSVFLAFLFSTVAGYRQLALFSIGSIGICVLFSLFVLPLIVGGPGRPGFRRESLPNVPRLSRNGGSIAIGIWVVAVVAGLSMLGSVEVKSDLRQFDGSEPYVIEAEERFERVWAGDGQPAILVASGRTLDQALRQNSQLYEEVIAARGSGRFASVAPVWPPRDERIQNAESWTSFWGAGRESRLRTLFAQIGPRYGFAPTAFDPFLDRLSIPADDYEATVMPGLDERFMRKTSGGYQVFSFFPDEESWLGAVREIADRHPGAFVVSRGSLADALARSVYSEVRFIAAVAAVLLPVLAFILLRSFRLTVSCLIPVISSVLAILVVPTAFGSGVTAPSMIVALIVVGLSIDYGIFVVHACERRVNTETTAAVTLSAVSTLIGTGALLLSRHPVLFSVGSTLVTGITAGYASAVLVLPAFYDRIVRAGESR